jgi:hypothetical protein
MSLGNNLGQKDIYGVRKHTKDTFFFIQYLSRGKTILNHDNTLQFLVSI